MFTDKVPTRKRRPSTFRRFRSLFGGKKRKKQHVGKDRHAVGMSSRGQRRSDSGSRRRKKRNSTQLSSPLDNRLVIGKKNGNNTTGHIRKQTSKRSTELFEESEEVPPPSSLRSRAGGIWEADVPKAKPKKSTREELLKNRRSRQVDVLRVIHWDETPHDVANASYYSVSTLILYLKSISQFKDLVSMYYYKNEGNKRVWTKIEKETDLRRARESRAVVYCFDVDKVAEQRGRRHSFDSDDFEKKVKTNSNLDKLQDLIDAVEGVDYEENSRAIHRQNSDKSQNSKPLIGQKTSKRPRKVQLSEANRKFDENYATITSRKQDSTRPNLRVSMESSRKINVSEKRPVSIASIRGKRRAGTRPTFHMDSFSEMMLNQKFVGDDESSSGDHASFVSQLDTIKCTLNIRAPKSADKANGSLRVEIIGPDGEEVEYTVSDVGGGMHVVSYYAGSGEYQVDAWFGGERVKDCPFVQLFGVK